MDLLNTPIKDLGKDGFIKAMRELDRQDAKTRQDNQHYVSPYKANRQHYIIRDDMGTHGVWNPADNKRYDSKSAYYRAVKNAGCEIVGNEPLTSKPKPQLNKGDHNVREELTKAVHEAYDKHNIKGRR